MIGSLESISQGYRPELFSYAFLISQIVKVVSAIFLLFVNEGDLISVLIIIIITQIAQIIMLVIFHRNHLTVKIELGLIRHWTKISWIPIFSAVPGLIYTLDMAVVVFITKSIESIAFYKIAFLLANYILYAQFLGIALYPKIIKGGNSKDIETVLKLMLMFLIPLTLGIYFISKDLLFILKPSYVLSNVIMNYLVPSAFIVVFLQFFDMIILGKEKVEIDESVSAKKLLKSKLFFMPLISVIQSVFYVSLLAIALFIIGENAGDEDVITIWALAALIAPLPILVYKGILAHKILPFRIPIKKILLYLTASLVMILVLYFVQSFNSFELSRISSILLVGGKVAIASFTYFIVLFAIDSDLRKMIKDYFNHSNKK
jgi:hypothetical protein